MAIHPKAKWLANRNYPFTVHPSDEGYEITFPDLPGCATYGDTLKEAIDNIDVAKLVWISGLLRAGERVPEPGEAERRNMMTAKEIAFVLGESVRDVKSLTEKLRGIARIETHTFDGDELYVMTRKGQYPIGVYRELGRAIREQMPSPSKENIEDVKSLIKELRRLRLVTFGGDTPAPDRDELYAITQKGHLVLRAYRGRRGDTMTINEIASAVNLDVDETKRLIKELHRLRLVHIEGKNSEGEVVYTITPRGHLVLRGAMAWQALVEALDLLTQDAKQEER